MYQLIGTSKLLTAFGITAALAALFYISIAPPEDASGYWRVASVSATFTGFLLFILGQTPFFPFISRLPIIRNHLPPIDGEWVGTFTSNYDKIAKAFKVENSNGGEPIVADFTIRARLFDVRINAVSRSPKPGYMRSDTTAFRINRCSMTHRIVIHYAYDAFVGDPHNNDVDRFHGAARLTILGEAKDLHFEGVYWTDRNWQKGMNTAGTLKLRRETARKDVKDSA